MASIANQSRFQRTLTLTVAESGQVLTLPAREGPYVVRIVSGTGTVEATISSAQDVLDDAANWFAWPAGEVSGPQDPETILEAQAIRFLVTADAVFEVMGVRS